MSRLETVLSTKNSTADTLGANAVFSGLADDLSSFQEIDINIAGAPSNAAGVLVFEFSPDGTNWDISISLPLTGPSMPPLPLRVVLPWFRLRYTNGATPLSELRITTVLHRTGAKSLTRFLNQPLTESEPIEVVRSVTSVKKPDGSYVNLQVTADEKLPIFAASLPLPSGASTEATLAAIKAKTDNLDAALSTRTKPSDQQHVLVDNFPITQPVSGPLTDAQLRASAVQVTGLLTDTQLRAAAIPVSASALPLPAGAATQTTLAAVLTELQTKTEPADQQHVLIDNLPSTQTVAGTVAVSNFPATQPVSGPLTDSQLRATPVPVSGPLTDVQLRAVAVPVSAAALPLPSGASTEATLAAIKAKTDNLDVALSSRTKPADNQNVLVTNWPAELGGGIEKTLYDIDDPSIFYIGTAPQGTASSDAAWLIKRILFDGSGNPLSTTWTGATAVWDNRSTESYS